MLAFGALSTGSVRARRLVLSAAAKVNLTLEVLGRRADGYHEIATVMQTVDLADRLTLEEAEGLELRTADPGVPTDASNLALKAAAALREAAGINRGVLHPPRQAHPRRGRPRWRLGGRGGGPPRD